MFCLGGIGVLGERAARDVRTLGTHGLPMRTLKERGGGYRWSEVFTTLRVHTEVVLWGRGTLF